MVYYFIYKTINLIKFKNIITNEYYQRIEGKDYFIAYDEPMSNEIAQQADNFRDWLNDKFNNEYSIICID
jgi:hypothetical protein